MHNHDRIWCPRCDQGWVVHGFVRHTKEDLFVCEECEAMWLSFSHIGKDSWVDFGVFMESKNLKPLWSELNVQN